MVKAIIFDLDGVIVSTDDYHYKAWKKMADDEGIPFDREENNLLRGISRRDSLEIILKRASKTYSEEEKEALMKKKNDIYVSLLQDLSSHDILPGFLDFLSVLKEKDIKTAIGSSSKNTKLILKQLGLLSSFDAIADGTEITHSKPNPEVFLLAAKKLEMNPKD
jgi:beta-phosphoglucomutase